MDQDLAARVGSGGAGGAGSRRRRTERQRGRRRRADRGGGSSAFHDNAIPARFNAGFARGGSARRQERDCGLYTADRRQEREGEGKKGSESSLATLRNFWGSELVEEKAWGRRRNGYDSREGRHHDEEDDELSTRVVSDFTGDARMRRMVGFWGKDYFRDSQIRNLPMGSQYFYVELA